MARAQRPCTDFVYENIAGGHPVNLNRNIINIIDIRKQSFSRNLFAARIEWVGAKIGMSSG